MPFTFCIIGQRCRFNDNGVSHSYSFFHSHAAIHVIGNERIHRSVVTVNAVLALRLSPCIVQHRSMLPTFLHSFVKILFVIA